MLIEYKKWHTEPRKKLDLWPYIEDNQWEGDLTSFKRILLLIKI